MKIPFKRPFYDEAEAEAVRRALGGADYTDRVRERLQDEYGGSVFLTASGSAALDALFLALELPPGSEVILPSFTYPSAANALVRCRRPDHVPDAGDTAHALRRRVGEPDAPCQP
jgi:dTDP-4-amino-4,6-dideoxygalactose transaminase